MTDFAGCRTDRGSFLATHPQFRKAALEPYYFDLRRSYLKIAKPTFDSLFTSLVGALVSQADSTMLKVLWM